MTGRAALGGRTAIVGVLVLGALAAVLIGWYRAGMREAAQQEAAQVEAARRDALDRASDHASALVARLEALRHAESARPYFHYQNLFHDPAGASEGLAVVPSPLASGPADPLVAVHFQIDEAGAVSSPSVNDELPDAVQAVAPDRAGLVAVVAARTALAAVADGGQVAVAGMGPQVAVADTRPPAAAPALASRPVRRAPRPVIEQQQRPPTAEPPTQVVSLEPDVYAQNAYSNQIFAATKQGRALAPVSDGGGSGSGRGGSGSGSGGFGNGSGGLGNGNEPVQQQITPPQMPPPQQAVQSRVAPPTQLTQLVQPTRQAPTQQRAPSPQRAAPTPQAPVPQAPVPQAPPQQALPAPVTPVQAPTPDAPVPTAPTAVAPTAVAPTAAAPIAVAPLPVRRRRPRPAPPPAPAPPAPVIVTVSPLTWHTVSIAGEPTLVAVRRVVTPDGARTQGLTVGRAQLAEWLAERGDAEATLGTDPGAAIGLGDSRWTITVDDHAALAYARATGAVFRDGFLVRFLPIAAVAMLCGGLVVLVTARSERLAQQRARFAAAAAHELRTPLAGIQLYGDMLGEQLGDPRKQRDYASRISVEAARLGRVVTNVLGVSQLERGGLTVRTETTDLVAAVRDAVERAEPGLTRAGAALELVAPTAAPARFDRDAVARIVGNLLDNAEKYSRDAADRRITITIATTATGDLEIAVRDRGPGLPAALRRGRFQAFHRGAGDDAPPGLGLGLALSQALALAMGGTLAPRPVSPGAELVLRVPAA